MSGHPNRRARNKRPFGHTLLRGGEVLEQRQMLALLAAHGSDSSNLAGSASPAALAFDGELNTAWVADNGTFPKSLTVDLGAIHLLDEIEQVFATADGWKYRIFGSNHNASNVGWTTLVDMTANSVQGTAFSHPVDAAYRYVKLEVTGATNSSVPSSAEFRIAGELLEQPRNLVPMPLPEDTGDKTIVAQACNLWSSHTQWEALQPYKFPDRLSVLGAYDEAYDVATDWQIKFAVENGISAMLSCWYRAKGNEGKPVLPMYDAFVNSMANSAEHRDHLQFGIMWENSNPVADGATGAADFLDNVVPYWIDEYFSRPNYWKIDGKPVVSIYNSASFIDDMGGVVAADTAIGQFRSAMTAAGFPGVVILTANNANTTASYSTEKSIGFDYLYNYHIPTFMDTMPADRSPGSMIAAHTQTWDNFEANSWLPYVLNVSVGWDATPWGGTQPIWKIPPAEFVTLLTNAKQRMDAKADSSVPGQVLFVDNWNEYSEGHFIMPSAGYGFGYVNGIRDVFSVSTTHAPNPTPDVSQVPQLLNLSPVTAVSVSGAGGLTKITQNMGTLQMVATTSPADAYATVSWSVVDIDGTSATDKATIHPNTGRLTALKNGQVLAVATADGFPEIRGELLITISGQLENLALGQPATASSFANYGENGSYPPMNAVDGNNDTMWLVNGPVYPSWLKVDLGQPEPLTRIVSRFINEQRANWKYKIDGSNDNSTWTTLVDRTASGVTAGIINESVSGTYRYVRLTLTAANAWPNSAEFIVFGTTLQNTSPTDIVLAPAYVPVNAAVGTAVGTLTTTDPEAESVFNYALVSGPGDDNNSLFSIVGNKLQTIRAIDLQTDRSLSVRIRTTDSGGLSYERAVVVTVASPDFDSNGLVDGEDYLHWKQTFGSVATPVGSGADGNADGLVNLADYALWRDNLGDGIVANAPLQSLATTESGSDRNLDRNASRSAAFVRHIFWQDTRSAFVDVTLMRVDALAIDSYFRNRHPPVLDVIDQAFAIPEPPQRTIAGSNSFSWSRTPDLDEASIDQLLETESTSDLSRWYPLQIGNAD